MARMVLVIVKPPSCCRCRQSPADEKLLALVREADRLPQETSGGEFHPGSIRDAGPALFAERLARLEGVVEDGDAGAAPDRARRDVETAGGAALAHVGAQPLRRVVRCFRRDLGLVAGERRFRQVHRAAGGDAERESRQLDADEAQVGGGALEEEQAVVRDLGERDRNLSRAVEDAALVAGAETGAVAQRRVAERRREQVVQAGEFGRNRQLGALVEERLQRGLLGVAVDELAGRVAELGFDDPAEGPRDRANPRVARASRPDSRRHGPALAWRSEGAPARRRGAGSSRAARGGPWRYRRRPTDRGCGRRAPGGARGGPRPSRDRRRARR